VSLLTGTAALLCYVLLIRGLVMLRSVPQYAVDRDSSAFTDEAEDRQNLVARIYAEIGRRTGPGLAELLGPAWRTWVDGLLAAAGQPRGFTVTGFAEYQGSFVTLGALAAVLIAPSGPFFALFLGLIMMGFPTWWLWLEADRRQRQIERELPDFLDILAVTVTAGLGFRQAMERVGETLAGPLAEEIRRTLRRMDVGVRRRQAFVELRERNPRSKTMGLFVTAILQAEELGAPLADTLNQLARDMRREFSQQARRRAARAAPRVSLIITMIIMPGIVALIVTAQFIGRGIGFPGR
jgi:tight adherence protein C